MYIRRTLLSTYMTKTTDTYLSSFFFYVFFFFNLSRDEEETEKNDGIRSLYCQLCFLSWFVRCWMICRPACWMVASFAEERMEQRRSDKNKNFINYIVCNVFHDNVFHDGAKMKKNRNDWLWRREQIWKFVSFIHFFIKKNSEKALLLLLITWGSSPISIAHWEIGKR